MYSSYPLPQLLSSMRDSLGIDVYLSSRPWPGTDTGPSDTARGVVIPCGYSSRHMRKILCPGEDCV